MSWIGYWQGVVVVGIELHRGCTTVRIVTHHITLIYALAH